MKIFYKKDYLEEVRKNMRLLGVVGTKEKIIKKLEEIKVGYEKIIGEQTGENYELKKEIKKLKGARGGFTKQINQLKNKNEKLEEEIYNLKTKLEESMTDKYLVKKIPSGRTPNTIKSKSPKSMSSAVRKYMKEAFDE